MNEKLYMVLFMKHTGHLQRRYLKLLNILHSKYPYIMNIKATYSQQKTA